MTDEINPAEQRGALQPEGPESTKAMIGRRRAAAELAAFGALALILRIAFDPLFWRFAGPVSLIATLVCLAIYLRRRGEGWSSVGLIPLRGVKAKLLVLPQALLVFGFFAAAVTVVLYGGEALGWTFLKTVPEASGIAGATSKAACPCSCYGSGLSGPRPRSGKRCFFAAFW
ncbi:hypothetical protein [Brevundimonas abyssalis]|uniref:Uncharacterized protein n=1 Tax=Brevundimonas abyssalis TAR-001 TaxID=1391729 RepID=A0A8E0KKV0_9CAUL|nr:hypothetical protein [Brevundimonas abyssalis]GAD58939.1 hypothetical protein MBEBAB_1189 [Brevundimonas abyssalis TAR-001]